MTVNGSAALDHLVEFVDNFLVAENCDDDWAVGLAKGCRWPVHVFREIDQEGRLHLRLGSDALLCHCRRRSKDKAEADKQRQKRPRASLPSACAAIRGLLESGI